MIDNFNIEFKFIDNMGDAITRAEERWNGTTVWVSRRKLDELSDTEKMFVLTHECCHAVCRQLCD